MTAAAAAYVYSEGLGLKKTTCLIADDHPAVIETVKTLLERRGCAVEQCVNGWAARTMIAELQPQLAILDVNMPGVDGIEVARSARETSRQTKVIVYTGHVDLAFLNDARDAGVSGFIGKDSDLDELMRAIHQVLAGQVYVDPIIAGQLMREWGNSGQLLTERERDVLRGIAQGLNHEQIAQQLYLAPTTVRTHLRKAMSKLGAANRANAVYIAVKDKLIS